MTLRGGNSKSDRTGRLQLDVELPRCYPLNSLDIWLNADASTHERMSLNRNNGVQYGKDEFDRTVASSCTITSRRMVLSP